MIKREIAEQFKSLQKQYPIVAVIGPRQSGKTTLVKKHCGNKPYVNLEDIENRDFAINDPKGFLAGYPEGAIIDEVQRVPDLLSYMQVIVDEAKQNGQFILTGSQNFLLMESISQSLAGRVAVLKLLPLSLTEVSPGGDLAEVLFTGMYPKLYDDKNVDVSTYYSNYIQTYIERDVRSLKNIVNLSSFRRFLILCASRTGQLLNMSSLANDAGIDQDTVKSWLAILEASFIIFILRPHHKNLGKRVIKMPKIYFYDTGLLCSLLNIESVEQVDSHYLRGGIFESFIIMELLKHRYNSGLNSNLYFWRDKLGNEVDILLDYADKISTIELKSGATIANDYFDGLKYYKQLSKASTGGMYVIYGGKQNQIRENIHIFGWKDLPKELPLK